MSGSNWFVAFGFVVFLISPRACWADQGGFLQKHCIACHDADTSEGGLDLTSVNHELSDGDVYSLWVKVHDRVRDGEMPPESEVSPST